MPLPDDVSITISKIISEGKIAEVVQTGNGDIVVRECTKQVKIKFPKNG